MTIEIREVATFTVEQLQALRELEGRTIAADGGRLKLEWGTIEGGHVTPALLAYEAGELVGYLGRYVFGDSPELAGMVDPATRRRGIGSMLLDTMLTICAERGDRTVLLVVPRTSQDGRALALARGSFDHAEHALQIDGEPVGAHEFPELQMRAHWSEEFERVSELIEEGFGHPARKSNNPGYTKVIRLGDDIIGTIRLIPEETNGGGVAYIGGFVITAAHRGKGYGRDILRRSVLELRDGGTTPVGLDVLTDNDNALHLYTSVGFRPVATEDYYAIPVQ